MLDLAAKPVLRTLVLVATLVASLGASRAQVPPFNQPYEGDPASVAETALDKHVLHLLRARNVELANPCSDAVFVRRVYVDVIGTLPTPEEARGFLEDQRPGKRAELIDKLLAREEFADYWALKWCDLLRVKSEFPINLWPNAVQAYHRWIRDSIRENRSIDQFARELLTSSGSNFRVPPVNFYRAVQGREPTAIADAVALTFMGSRADKWPAATRSGMAAFFSRITYKPTGEWKEEIVCLNPASTDTLKATLPDGTAVKIPPDRDPRRVFADWLIKPHNPWFARNISNRVWSWLFGRGIVHEPDDMGPHNPPTNPELLDFLQHELVNARFDLRHLYRIILNSRTYQQSSIPRSQSPDVVALFACYPVRRLDAEVLMDALCMITGSGEGYSSPIPEPFTFVPEYQRSIKLADGSINSPFLELFGRPTRDTGLESERNSLPTDGQRLHLLNSNDIQRRIERSQRLMRLVQDSRGRPAQAVRMMYLAILSRYPTDEELAVVAKSVEPGRRGARQALDDLAWALINTKEFLYRH